MVPGDRLEIFAAVTAALMKERIEHEKSSLCADAPDIMGLAFNTGHLAVRGEPGEPPATHPENAERTGVC